MLKKSITYTDFNGNEVTEDFYFNLSKAEIVEMELSVHGGLKDHLEKIIAAEDGKEIIAQLKHIILKAYGKRSEDGKQFIKNDQIREEFASTEAYSELFMELATQTDAAIEFTNGIIPKDMRDNPNQAALPIQKGPDHPNLTPQPQKLTQAEVAEMDSDELKSGLATGKYIL